MHDELIKFDALGLASLIKNKDITPQELLSITIKRAEKINPKINAIINYLEAFAEKSLAQINSKALFAGVPFLLKDLTTQLGGEKLSQGSLFFKDIVSQHNSEIVNRFQKQGLVIFGKTNTPELGMCCSTEPNLWGPTHNPWNFDFSPGGSSGGSAAAVAARIVPMAHATDGGGSIRIPAAYCGIVGLKPTRARMPAGPDFGEGVAGLTAAGVVSISLRDTAAILDAISGSEIGSPYQLSQPEISYVAALQQSPKPLRIAYSSDMGFGIKVDEECLRAVSIAAQYCESLGHIVEEAKPEFNPETTANCMKVFFTSATKLAVNMHSQMLGRGPTSEELEHNTQIFLAAAEKYSGADYLMAINMMHAEARKISYFFENYDVLITPTVAKARLPLGYVKQPADTLDEVFDRLSGITPFTALWNQTGQPAISLPLHWTDDHFPVGVQFIGKYADEKTLLQLSAQLEMLAPWAEKIPSWVTALS